MILFCYANQFARSETPETLVMMLDEVLKSFQTLTKSLEIPTSSEVSHGPLELLSYAFTVSVWKIHQMINVNCRAFDDYVWLEASTPLTCLLKALQFIEL